MPYHVSKSKSSLTIKKNNKEKKMKLEKPVNKERKTLSPRQKDLMKVHKEHHTKEHLDLMTKLMKKGFCFEQAHAAAQKAVGK